MISGPGKDILDRRAGEPTELSRRPWEALVPSMMRGALEGAYAHGDAELSIRTTEGSGRIFVCRGAIAWIVSSDTPGRFSEMLSARHDIDRARLKRTLQHCRRHGGNFAETLVAQGHLKRDAMRVALLEHNAWQLSRLLEGRLLDVELIPNARAYSSDLVFSIAEIVDAIESRELRVPAPRESSEDANPRETANTMSNIKQSLEEVMKLEGAIAAALVDWESGLTLGTVGGGLLDIELAASGNTSVVKAKMNVMRQLGIQGSIEDILITLQSQYHIIRPLSRASSLFLYVAIDRDKGNLGLARHKLKQIEEGLSI